MVICATLWTRSDKGASRTTRNARGYCVCATLQGGASQGAAQVFAPLRHLRHPLYRVAKVERRTRTWTTPQKLLKIGGVQ
jgi:hypothetical protein